MTAFQLTQKLEAMEPALDGALALLSALTQELEALKARVSTNETVITVLSAKTGAA